VWQLGDVRGNPPRLIAGEELYRLRGHFVAPAKARRRLMSFLRSMRLEQVSVISLFDWLAGAAIEGQRVLV
jgi:hypothetical protein